MDDRIEALMGDLLEMFEQYGDKASTDDFIEVLQDHNLAVIDADEL